MTDQSRTAKPRRGAFSLDAAGQAARSAMKAAWWGGAGALARRITKPEAARPDGFAPSGEPSPPGMSAGPG